MLVPLSWLKEYVPITLPLPKLVERLSEIGVGVEAVHKKEEDTILELEITPNRPDLLSIVGVAREVAAIESGNRILTVKIPNPVIPSTSRQTKKLAKGQSSSGRKLPITIKVDYKLSPRVSAIIINNVKVKESPLWLAERLTAVGFRSINNIVDITNYVMFELGNPLHAFDYDQIKGHQMTVTGAAGGELFTTVDKLTYKLPKEANIIKDKERIIDLCGIKGGLNSAITEKTRTVLLWAAVDDGPNIRQTCQALSLRSNASHIYERGVNRGGTLDALARATALIRKLAGGDVASSVIDLKRTRFHPWQIDISLKRIEKLLGVSIEEKKVLRILTSLNLSPKKVGDTIACTIPTYRNDLQIEEDLIEEVARIYGYNKFPKTLPKGEIPLEKIPYEKAYKEELQIKDLLRALSLSEVNTYSLVSRQDAQMVTAGYEELIIIANPVSREFEVLRPSLLINLLKAIPLNLKHRENIRLFELGKIYHKHGKEAKETRSLAAVLYPADYFLAKGVVESLTNTLGPVVHFEPTEESLFYQRKKAARIIVDPPAGWGGKERIGTLGEVGGKVLQQLGLIEGISCFEIDFEKLITLAPATKIFTPIPKYPPVIEDISVVTSRDVLTGDMIAEMKATNHLVASVDFLDMFEDTRTFRITYQDPNKNLSSADAAVIRKQILHRLKKKFNAELKG